MCALLALPAGIVGTAESAKQYGVRLSARLSVPLPAANFIDRLLHGAQQKSSASDGMSSLKDSRDF